MGGATGGASGQYAEQTRNLFEEENNSQISALKDQVSALKELTLDINTEVNEQNKFLNNMSNDFDSTEGLLGGTMGKLKHMVEQGCGRPRFGTPRAHPSRAAQTLRATWAPRAARSCA